MGEVRKLAAKDDLPAEGQAKEFNLDGKVICVANVNGSVTAIDNVCLHRGGPVGQGVVMDGKIICPWHGWRWDPQTGAAAHDPAAKLAVYPLRVEGDDVFIET